MDFLRLNRRKAVFGSGGIAVFLLVNYLCFFGLPDFEDYYAKSVEFTVPSGFSGSLVVSVSSKVRPNTESGVFRLKLDGEAKDRIIPKSVGEARIDSSGNLVAYRETTVKSFPTSPPYVPQYTDKLFVMDVKGIETQIAETEGTPVWSPDGQWIVCTNIDGPNGSDGQRDLSKAKWTTWKYAIDGSTKTELPLPEKCSVQDWSSDGRWFLASKYGDPGRDLLIDTADPAKSVVLIFQERPYTTRFSRDGTKIFFICWDEDRRGIICSRELVSDQKTVALGTETTVVYRGKPDHGINDFSCSPDGQFLAVATLDMRNQTGKIIERGHLELVKLADASIEALNVTHAAHIISVDWR
jgi:dipeptidyl aminopeptidase/acylaminoacyl peptidase